MTTASKVLAEADTEAARALRIIEGMPGFAWSADAAGRFTYVSPHTLAFLGEARENLNTSDDEDEFGWRRVVHPDDYDRVAARWRHCLQTGDHYDAVHRLRRADGVYRWFRNSGRPSRDSQGRITGWYGTTMDIEEQKQAEAALRDRERELSQLVDMVPSLIWRLTPDGAPIFFNKRMVDFLGLDVADTERPGMSRLEALIETIHPDDAAGFRDSLGRCLITGEPFSMSYRLRRTDGVYRWMSGRAEPMRDQDGRIVQWYGLCHDIDDQTRLYRDIAEREARIRRLIDSDIIGIVIWDLDGTLIDANEAFLRMVQYEREDVEAGLRWFDMTPPDWQEVHADEEAEELAATGKMQAREKEFFRKDGGRVPVLIGAACFEGQSRQGVAYILDLTERKRAEAALCDRESELSQLVNVVPSYLWRITPDGVPVFFNKRLVDFLGLDVTDADKPDRSRLDAFIEAAIHPDDALAVAEAFERSLASGERLSMKWRMRRADGVYRWMAASAEAMRDQDGHIAQWYGLCHDIDDQLQAEEALRKREQELSQLVDALPVHIWSWTPAGKLAYVNKRSLEDLGLSGANFEDITRVAQKLVHPEDAPEVLRTSARCLKTGDTFMMQYRRRWKDGNYRWIEARAQPLRDRDGTIVHWYQVSIDIDDQVRAQAALRESERRYRDVFHYMPIGLTQVDASKLIPLFKELQAQGLTDLQVYIDEHPEFLPRAVEALEVEEVNRHIIEMFGAKNAEEMRGPITRYWVAGLSTIRRSIEARYRGEEIFQEETKVVRMDGSVIDVLFTTARPGAVANKSLVGFIDITERKKAEEALHERERELSQLVNIVPSHLWRLTPDGEPIFFSKRMVDFLGLDVADMDKPGMSRLEAVIETVHPDDAAKFRDNLRHCLVTGERFSMNYRLRRADGVHRWMSSRAEPLRDQDGRIVQWFGLCHDIDDQMHAEDALRRASDKLAQATQAASLAELSASIAHEVNQPLAAIVANANACYRWLSAAPPNLERAKISAERIIRDANSAADVVSRIRALFKHSVDPRNYTALDCVIAEARNLMAEEAVRRHVRMDIDVESNLPLLAFDRVQIQQVLINLMRNAFEAMDSVAGEKVLGMRTRRIGDVVQTEISDRGGGVESPEKIFDPFVTTKRDGMGMGLAICRSIIESHGGRLWAERNEPQGAKFIFTLPVESKAAS
jgi:hypothetical protein